MEVKVFRSVWFILFMLTFAALIASCSSTQTNPSPEANLPNPASVFCEQHGGKLDFRTDASGGVSGVCVFPDGSECDEWAYFRDECQPGNAPGNLDPTATPGEMDSAWIFYHNAEFGYRLSYPASAKIVMNDDPLHGFSILGPEKDGESWPSISISHPRDREEYRPPEGTDLLQWLTGHNLLGADRKPDTQIAGTLAIHFRHERSPQSYAFDTYYFARSGQLYQIIIGHTGDKEDWSLYNQFLAGIQFE
jgi:putative hemolysin